MAGYWLAIKTYTADNIVQLDCSTTIQLQQQQHTEIPFQETHRPMGGKSEKAPTQETFSFFFFDLLFTRQARKHLANIKIR